MHNHIMLKYSIHFYCYFLSSINVLILADFFAPLAMSYVWGLLVGQGIDGQIDIHTNGQTDE
jgi:hypothetical protein